MTSIFHLFYSANSLPWFSSPVFATLHNLVPTSDPPFGTVYGISSRQSAEPGSMTACEQVHAHGLSLLVRALLQSQLHWEKETWGGSSLPGTWAKLVNWRWTGKGRIKAAGPGLTAFLPSAGTHFPNPGFRIFFLRVTSVEIEGNCCSLSAPRTGVLVKSC